MNLLPELLNIDWQGKDEKHWKAGVVLPERMVALKHPKAAKLLSNMAIKYGILQNHLNPIYKSTVLDVGCGSGFGASILRDFGYRVSGIDVDPFILSYARKRPGIQFYEGFIKDHPHTYDAITCVDMIEHIHAPQQELLMHDMYRHLNPEGVLLVDTCFRIESARVSKHHVWELGYQDFVNLFINLEMKNITRYWILRYFDTYSVCIKSQMPPKYDKSQAELLDQIIVATK